ncbi:MAG: LPS export ABC transporter permease LptG [Pseudomonadales bacterium]|nr:LPS export ABC transporter permease LptG [Pseudomonadales bacterium]
MKRLDIYIMQTIGMTMLLAAVGLLGILTIFTFIEQVEDIQNNYTIAKVLEFTLLSMPRMFYEVIPYSALIGCLAGLGIMANNSELVVMRAAGVSTWQITVNVVKPALILVFLGLYVGEYILPDVERMARNNRNQALSEQNEITPNNGFWYRERNIYMHFAVVEQGGLLEGISHFYVDDKDNLTRTLFAQRGVFHDVREDEKYWLLENVDVTELGADGTRTEHLTSLRWDTGLEPDILSTEILVQPDKMSIGELSAKIDYMRSQGLNTGKFEVGFWEKIFQPFATVALVFVAISFIFGPLRESTMGVRVVSGLIIGIVFKFVQDLLSPASMVFGFPPVIAVMIPILICFGVGWQLLRKAG